jgi:hypothetical protein
MDLDIRVPIGLLFVTLGGLLAIHGLLASPAIFARHSLGLNINLGWGLAMAVFGGAMLILVATTRSRGQ